MTHTKHNLTLNNICCINKYSELLRLSSFSYEHLNLTAVEIENVFFNRHLLKMHGVNKAGIYVWITPDGRVYVGRSINLYARVRSYFHNVPKYKGVSLIRNYLNKHGFVSMRLILYLFSTYTFNDLVRAEQAFLDFIKPSLNLDKHATTSRFNQPMESKIYEHFKKKRSRPILVFDATTNDLLWTFDTKKDCIRLMKIHYSTLNTCIATNKMYLNYFRFKYSINSNLDAVVKGLENFLKLVQKKRKTINYKTRNKKF